MDDELYDSLEDELRSFSDLSLASDDSISRRCQKVTYNLTDLVPLYNGEICKNNISISKKQSQPIISKIPVLSKRSHRIINKCSDSDVNSNNRVRKTKKNTELVKLKEEKTYLKLFHAKIGYPDNQKIKSPHDTTRGNDGDLTYRTATSGSMEYLDAKTPSSVTDSEENFYLNHVKNDTVVPPLKLSDRNSCIFLKSSASSTNNFKSVTCQNLSKFYKNNKNLLSDYTTNIPVLGGLGPDILRVKDKLLRYRKQREYGQNASNRNRLKILEAKILNNLETITNNVNIAYKN